MQVFFKLTPDIVSISYTTKLADTIISFFENQLEIIAKQNVFIRTSLVLALTTLCLVWISNILNSLTTPRRIKNIPYVKSYIPFFNSLSVIFPKAQQWLDSPCLKFQNLAIVYGDVYQIKLGNKLIVIANSYDSIRALWCNKSIKGNNSRPITHSFHKVLSNGIYTVGTTPMGNIYKKSRKHISATVLSEKRNKDYNTKVINKAVDEMLIRIIGRAKRRRVIHDELLRECQYFHLKVALLVTYGFNLDLESPEHIKMANSIIKVENEITKVRSHIQNIQDYLHGPFRYIWSYFSGYEIHARKLSKIRESYLNMFYNHALERYIYSIQYGVFDETIRESLMFDYFYKSKNNVSKTEITSICLTMVSAGLDNVALNFKYGIHQLALHPELWNQGYNELINLFTTEKTAIEHCYLNRNCNYINAIVKETLRMFTVLPMALPRQTTAAIQYKNSIIPSGTILFMNCWGGNHDAKVFNKPLEFHPERYLDRNGELNNLKHFSYGVGSRMCLGSQFANRELYILFSKFLLKFEPLERQMEIPANPLETNQFPESLAIEPIEFDVGLKVRNL